jgi:hypothetical protein
LATENARKTATVIVVVAFAAYASRVLALLVRYDGYDLGKYLLADDAFYYLRIAHNVAHGRGSTFDGLAATNGYHPLWEVVCIALSLFFPAASKAEISVMFALQAGLNAVAAWAIYTALRSLNAVAAAATVAMLLASAAIQGTLTNGMESALAFAFMAALLRVAVARSPRFVLLDSAGYAATIFALLVALALSRLEMGLVAAAFLALSLWRCRAAGDGTARAARSRALAVLAGLGAVACGYLLVNCAVARWPLPISGAVKWTATVTLEDKLLTAQSHLRAFVALLRIHQAMQRPLLEAALGLLLAAALAAEMARREAMHEIALVLGLPCLLFTLLAIDTAGAFQWYCWPALFIGTLATFALVDGADQLVGRWRHRWIPGAHVAIAALVCTFTLGVTVARVDRAGTRLQLYDWSLSPTLMDHAIDFVVQRIARDELLCGHSVGLVSYMTDRGIVHTEGLVNDREYFESLRAGRAAERLRSRHVRWLMANVQDPEDEAQRRAMFPSCAIVERHSVVDEYGLAATPEAARAIGSADVVFFRIDHAACPSTAR